jgi:hypothetical protein
LLDSEFKAVAVALADYRRALRARSKITDRDDYIPADRDAYDAERRVILKIPLEESDDNIPV